MQGPANACSVGTGRVCVVLVRMYDIEKRKNLLIRVSPSAMWKNNPVAPRNKN